MFDRADAGYPHTWRKHGHTLHQAGESSATGQAYRASITRFACMRGAGNSLTSRLRSKQSLSLRYTVVLLKYSILWNVHRLFDTTAARTIIRPATIRCKQRRASSERATRERL